MPSPTITWLRPNGEVVAVIGGAPQFGTLTRSNTGVYACVANNLAGERRAEFTVTVQGMRVGEGGGGGRERGGAGEEGDLQESRRRRERVGEVGGNWLGRAK